MPTPTRPHDPDSPRCLCTLCHVARLTVDTEAQMLRFHGHIEFATNRLAQMAPDDPNRPFYAPLPARYAAELLEISETLRLRLAGVPPRPDTKRVREYLGLGDKMPAEYEIDAVVDGYRVRVHRSTTSFNPQRQPGFLNRGHKSSAHRVVFVCPDGSEVSVGRAAQTTKELR